MSVPKATGVRQKVERLPFPLLLRR